jgi:hypothetical protein
MMITLVGGTLNETERVVSVVLDGFCNMYERRKTYKSA